MIDSPAEPVRTPSTTGMVFLVGAGPGDPGLITLRAIECLEQAEVVVHDRLVNRLLLRYAPQAEWIDVGKCPEHHPVPQDRINALLIEKARLGQIVVRLKGGDPFVFGRGGEEALALVEAGIPFEIVPGITSAIAVPAYAGIPVTQRNVAGSLTIVAGHRSRTETSIDWFDDDFCSLRHAGFFDGRTKSAAHREHAARTRPPSRDPHSTDPAGQHAFTKSGGRNAREHYG